MADTCPACQSEMEQKPNGSAACTVCRLHMPADAVEGLRAERQEAADNKRKAQRRGAKLLRLEEDMDRLKRELKRQRPKRKKCDPVPIRNVIPLVVAKRLPPEEAKQWCDKRIGDHGG